MPAHAWGSGDGDWGGSGKRGASGCSRGQNKGSAVRTGLGAAEPGMVCGRTGARTHQRVQVCLTGLLPQSPACLAPH